MAIRPKVRQRRYRVWIAAPPSALTPRPRAKSTSLSPAVRLVTPRTRPSEIAVSLIFADKPIRPPDYRDQMNGETFSYILQSHMTDQAQRPRQDEPVSQATPLKMGNGM